MACNFVVALLTTVVVKILVFLALAIGCLPDKLQLLFLQSLLILLVELVATFVITTVVNKDASVSETTIAVLVIIFAPLRVMVHSSRNLYKSWCSLWSFQSA